MITKTTSMCSCNGTTRELSEYRIRSTDLTDNGDGTYQIKGVQGLNGDQAIVIDTGMLLLCDGETGKWHKFGA
jgi:hypothetical protein